MPSGYTVTCAAVLALTLVAPIASAAHSPSRLNAPVRLREQAARLSAITATVRDELAQGAAAHTELWKPFYRLRSAQEWVANRTLPSTELDERDGPRVRMAMDRLRGEILRAV